MDENSVMLTHFNNTEYKVCLEVLSKYCEYWNVFNNGSLSQNMLGWIGWMEVKFHPEVKKSMSRFHCPVFSRSDLVIIKIASALSTKPGVQKLCQQTFGSWNQFIVWPSGSEKHRPWSPEVTSQDKQKIITTTTTKEWISSTFLTLFNFV